MDSAKKHLPERRNRGNRMSELAKDEAKILDDEKYGEIFKEESSDDDFNPEDINREKSSSEEDEENEEEESDEEEEEQEEKIPSPKKNKNKKNEEILDIEQLDIDKIDMIEDLKDKGIDISDEEELEKKMQAYYDDESFSEEVKNNKKKIKKKKVQKKNKKVVTSILKSDLEKEEIPEINSINLKEENENETKKNTKLLEIKNINIKKEKIDSNNLRFNPNVSVNSKQNVISINKSCLDFQKNKTENSEKEEKLKNVTPIKSKKNNKQNFNNSLSMSKLNSDEKMNFSLNRNNKKENIDNKNKNSEIKQEIIGHKRTRNEKNNTNEFITNFKREKYNKNVSIIGSRENPKYIVILKKIYDPNDEIKTDKNKKKKETSQSNEKEKEEILKFDLEQEMDTKNIIKKFKKQEKEKKQFGIQEKFISQEQRLLESIFTELTNKQSLKTMQKLEDLNKRENLYVSRKTLGDIVKINITERHLINDKEKENKKEEDEKKEDEEKKEDNILDNTLIKEYKEKEKKINKVQVTFTNREYYKNLFNNLNKKPIIDKKEKVCAITGKPAKYFDPVTKNYYSTIDAFKILRERYYQKEEDCLLFKIQTLSDLASQKKERLKKMLITDGDSKNNDQISQLNNLNNNVKNTAIKLDTETMSIEGSESTGNNINKNDSNNPLLKIIHKYGLLKNSISSDDNKKIISHRVYSRNRENCVESGMLVSADKIKVVISKKIFKDKFSCKLPGTDANE